MLLYRHRVLPLYVRTPPLCLWMRQSVELSSELLSPLSFLFSDRDGRRGMSVFGLLYFASGVCGGPVSLWMWFKTDLSESDPLTKSVKKSIFSPCFSSSGGLDRVLYVWRPV